MAKKLKKAVVYQKKRRPRKLPPKGGPDYRQLWRVVDGAMMMAFHHHPDYFTDKGHMAARESIDKRVTGALMGYLAHAGWSRPEFSSAADKRGLVANSGLSGRL